MALPQEQVEAIACQVIKTLYDTFALFPVSPSSIRNAPFHMAFLRAFQNRLEPYDTDNAEFGSPNYGFHGLNTTLGQSFFENVSHILCDGMKRQFTTLKISQAQQTNITDIITELKNNTQIPNLSRENELIYANNTPLEKAVSNFTADCYYEDDEKIVAIELKTVKPNSGIFKGEKDKILSAKAGLKNANQTKEIYFYLGFPFDPLSATPTGSNKTAFMNYSVDFTKFFAPDEVLLADELWDFLSGDTNTIQQIIDIINAIASPQFMQKYNFLNDRRNRTADKVQYLQLLAEWKLFSEIAVVNEEALLLSLAGNKRLIRQFNQPIFKEGEYNLARFIALKGYLN